MSELRDVLKAHDDALAASVRVSAEFDAGSARSGVRRRRTARAAVTATASVAAAGALVAGGWWAYGSQGDPASPLVSPSASLASPSVSPSASANGRGVEPGLCPSRADSMTEAEADAIVAEPLTGEVWLDVPVPTAAPATPPGTDAATWSDSSTWYEVGTREDATILAAYDFMQGVQLIEVAPDGGLTWIANPFPGNQESPADWLLDGVTKDTERCYESLAIPSEVPLVDGVVASTSAEGYGPAAAVLPDSRAVSYIEMGAAGGTTLTRLHVDYPLADLTGPGVSLPSFTGMTFALLTPFGGWLQLEFNPLEGATDATGTSAPVDYFDTRCGEDPGFQAIVPDTADADWAVTGTLRGRDLAVATATNPFAAERYAAYVNHFALIGDTETVPATYEQFIADGGLVALRADDGGWWVQLNVEYTPRVWC